MLIILFSPHILREDLGHELDIKRSIFVFWLISIPLRLVSVASSANDICEMNECLEEGVWLVTEFMNGSGGIGEHVLKR